LPFISLTDHTLRHTRQNLQVHCQGGADAQGDLDPAEIVTDVHASSMPSVLPVPR
jgi:hypothetical protein